MAKVLIVDDSPTIVALLKKGLESDKCKIITSDNGIDALTLARKEMPDLMLLDLMLPKMDGFHVCTMIKKDEKLKQIKVIMLTGRQDSDSKNLGLECGADKFITKDTDPLKIIEAANSMLS